MRASLSVKFTTYSGMHQPCELWQKALQLTPECSATEKTRLNAKSCIQKYSGTLFIKTWVSPQKKFVCESNSSTFVDFQKYSCVQFWLCAFK